jgi:LSU ribosomal protein L1P
MAKLTKRQKQFAEKLEAGRQYPVEQAIELLQSCATAKFRESMDMSVNLGVDARKSDENVRGSTVLPHGSGKSVRVAVFAQGAKADEARAAGADAVGMDDLAETLKGGDLGFQVIIAEPAAMRVVGALGQLLGPRGLMPNPKTGTVTPNVGEAVKNAKAGMAKFRSTRPASFIAPSVRWISKRRSCRKTWRRCCAICVV